MWRLNKLDEAERLHKHAFHTQCQELGEGHADTLASLNNLALVRLTQRRLEEGQRLIEQTWRITRGVFGEKHPRTLGAMSNLANVLQQQGKLAEARVLQEKALRLYRRTLGPEHPDTLGSVCNLAGTLERQQQYGKAFLHHEHALRVRRRVLGEDHPFTLQSIHHMAWFLVTVPDERLLDPPRALQLAHEATQRLPREAGVWNTLGVVLYRNGKWTEAIEALEKSRALSDGGSSHEFFFLAMAHWKLDKPREARQFYELGVKWMRKHAPQGDMLARFRAEAEELLGLSRKEK
jgi:tetratricopeptide (TPR) repeat protein